MAKYYENKRRLSGETRYCSECGETKLSKYNESTVCAGCIKRQHVAAEQNTSDFLLALGE